MAAWALALAGLIGVAPSAKAEFFEYRSTVTISDTSGTFTPSGATFTNGTTAGGNTFSTITLPDGNSVTLFGFTSGNDTTTPHLNASDPVSIGTDIAPVIVSTTNEFGTVGEDIAFNFNVTLNLTNYLNASDTSPDGTGSVTFTGRISGSIGNNAVALNLLSFVPTSTTVVVGTELYDVSFDATSGFASPGGKNVGGISLHVFARPVPEPGSLALLGMGGVGALGVFLRRRARASA